MNQKVVLQNFIIELTGDKYFRWLTILEELFLTWYHIYCSCSCGCGCSCGYCCCGGGGCCGCCEKQFLDQYEVR